MTSTVDPSQPAIALVEDDESLRVGLTRLLRCARFDVHPFATAEALLATTRGYACFVLDVQLPGMPGLELAEQLHASGDRTPIVFVTGSGGDQVREIKRRTGRTCLTKPVEEAALLMAIATALVRG